MRRSAAESMLLGTVTLWAFNFTVSKYILDQGFHPLAYSSVRYSVAALVFAAITLGWEGSVPISTGLLARGAGVERQGFRFSLAAVFSFGGVALVAAGSGGNLSTNLKGDT